jgi:6-phosphogluconolactonase
MGLWVGSYGEKGGKGLYPLDPCDACFVFGDPEPRIANASFAVWSAQHRLVYVVNDQDDGRIAAWRPGEAWQPVGDVPSGGALPCYLAVSPDGQWLACANYGDGVVTIFAIDPDTGAIDKLVSSYKPSGHGCNAERQDGPHAHCVVFAEDSRTLYHVDLGLDRVFRHDLDGGLIASTDIAFAAPPGSGPRHLMFHPAGFALLLCELSAQLMLLRRDDTQLTCIQVVPTAPEPVSGENLGGHLAIEPAGDILVTNRGHDSLVGFALRGKRLEIVGWHHSGGQSPRHLHVVGDRVIVAHEEGGGLTSVPLPGCDLGILRIAAIPGAAFVLDIPE